MTDEYHLELLEAVKTGDPYNVFRVQRKYLQESSSHPDTDETGGVMEDELCTELLAWAADEENIKCHSQGYDACIFCWGYLDDDLDEWEAKKHGHKDNCLHVRVKMLMRGKEV